MSQMIMLCLRIAGIQAARTVLAGLLLAMALIVILSLSGAQVHAVTGTSMTPAVRAGDVLLSRPVLGAVRPGQIVVVDQPGDGHEPISHRVISIDGEHIVTRGDANLVNDGQIPVRRVEGVVFLRVPAVGLGALWLLQGNLPALAFSVVMICLMVRIAAGRLDQRPGDHPHGRGEGSGLLAADLLAAGSVPVSRTPSSQLGGGDNLLMGRNGEDPRRTPVKASGTEEEVGRP